MHKTAYGFAEVRGTPEWDISFLGAMELGPIGWKHNIFIICLSRGYGTLAHVTSRTEVNNDVLMLSHTQARVY